MITLKKLQRAVQVTYVLPRKEREMVRLKLIVLYNRWYLARKMPVRFNLNYAIVFTGEHRDWNLCYTFDFDARRLFLSVMLHIKSFI